MAVRSTLCRISCNACVTLLAATRRHAESQRGGGIIMSRSNAAALLELRSGWRWPARAIAAASSFAQSHVQASAPASPRRTVDCRFQSRPTRRWRPSSPRRGGQGQRRRDPAGHEHHRPATPSSTRRTSRRRSRWPACRRRSISIQNAQGTRTQRSSPTRRPTSPRREGAADRP